MCAEKLHDTWRERGTLKKEKILKFFAWQYYLKRHGQKQQAVKSKVSKWSLFPWVQNQTMETFKQLCKAIKTMTY